MHCIIILVILQKRHCYDFSACALRVTAQAGSVGPSTIRLRRPLRRAHRGLGGYCRHSGNQGTTGRPARAHNPLQKISLRTRLSKPGGAPQAWRGSPSLAGALQASRGSSSQLCLRDRAHMGSASSAELRVRQRAVMVWQQCGSVRMVPPLVDGIRGAMACGGAL